MYKFIFIFIFLFVILKAGAPIGLNYYDSFMKLVKYNDDSFKKNFKALKDLDISYIRINGSGFYFSEDWKFYFNNKKAYFEKMDYFIKEAEKYNIKIIFSMFWKYDAIPKLMHESIKDAYSNKNSKTIKFIKDYTKEIVQRYSNSPAIYIWELGNEYNLQINLKYKKVKNARTKRPIDNVFKLSYLNNLMKVFKKEIRKYDKIHFIETGNSIPRIFTYGYKLNKNNYSSILKQIITDENKYSDLISVHIYPWDLRKRKYFQYFNNIDNFLKFLEEYSMKINKKLYIGEFGDCRIKKKNEQEVYFINFIKLMNKYDVLLSTYWVYDRKIDQRCNIDPLRLNFIFLYNKNCF